MTKEAQELKREKIRLEVRIAELKTALNKQGIKH
jgi:hypothetical protein